MMPRTLPWLLDQTGAGRVKQESAPRKRVKTEPIPDRDLTTKKLPSSPEKQDFFRSSQTPPTSPIRRCPSEEFLIEGLDHDDVWVMVEDEFYAVAQTFTQHLHYAEYVRRKKEAKAQSAMGIEEPDRPTDGRTAMPKQLQHKKNAEALATRQKAGLDLLLEGQTDEKDDTEEDDTWAGTHLHDLMTSPRKTRSLVGARALRSSTRAAAGFGQAPASNCSQVPGISRVDSVASTRSKQPDAQVLDLDQETASEDDDLELQSSTVAAPRTREMESNASSASNTPIPYKKDPRQSTSSRLALAKEKEKPASARNSQKPSDGFKSRMEILFDELDELPAPSAQDTSISDKEKELPSVGGMPQVESGEDKLEPSKSRYTEVPTFLV